MQLISTLLFSAGIFKFIGHVNAGADSVLRSHLIVPNLTEVRNILSALEGPIVSTIVSRAAMPADAILYAKSNKLLKYIRPRELVADASGRYAYGTLEYPFTLPLIAPDHSNSAASFPPGTFHQDTFSPNPNLTAFYVDIFVPLLRTANEAIGGTSSFFHLTSPTVADVDAKYNIDATLLALLSHRASIGKVVAESKYGANVSGFTPLIRAKDAATIRVLLTNTTQEQVVLSGAAAACQGLASAWEGAEGADANIASNFITALQEAVAIVFKNLISITTEVEVEYMLQRLN